MPQCAINVYVGNIIHCSKPFTVEVLKNSFIAVNQNQIIAIDSVSTLENFKNEQKNYKINEVVLSEYQILIPGLIDTHIHAPQYPNLGLGLDKNLPEWLEQHTFLLEQKFENLDFAKKCYEVVVKKTISHGTTTAAYYATFHTEPSLILAEIAIKYGQRAFIGKVNITLNPETYGCESETSTIEETKRFVLEVLNKKSTLVQPIITPRHTFRISTHALKGLCSLAKTYDLRIQYNSFVDPYTIVGHTVHIPIEEVHELARHKTSVSHCPSSNFNLQSGICNVKALLDAGINVGLGSDISAGSNVGIVDQMRSAITASRALSFHIDKYKPINCYDAFYMATLGGAKALAIDTVVGNFAVRKDFDALIVDMNVEHGNSQCLLKYDPLELFQKFVYVGDDRNIVSVFIAGKNVK
ncbi:hypothetical protein RN001_002021 [Aquatica leii]|uniref:Amidohydrolase-related domain-containing protein n=1 Tax=Aquatica leii TaxID=1421715 RepID=A0AAN7SSR6_9COLE|nr:hypothetical protein RN001_002021 [Aquatica leii]